jgi:hypothetical protein
VLKSDFLFWAFKKVAKAELMAFIGVPKHLQKDLSREDRTNVDQTLDSILPVSRRYQGILKDSANHASRQRASLEAITAETLVIDAEDMETFTGAKYTASQIRNAQLVSFPEGGHLLVGHWEEAQKAVRDLLRRASTASPRDAYHTLEYPPSVAP